MGLHPGRSTAEEDRTLVQIYVTFFKKAKKTRENMRRFFLPETFRRGKVYAPTAAGAIKRQDLGLPSLLRVQ